jgi:hypothetical protein
VQNETAEQAAERRLRESEGYNERVAFVNSMQEWESQIREAGNKLVVLEVQ